MKRLFLLGVLLCGCAPPTSLQGSLGDELSLDFDSVRIERGDHTIALSYLQSVPGTTGTDTVLSIVASTDGVDLSKGGTLHLTDEMSDGGLRGTVTRAVHDDARRTFTPLSRGTLTFDQAPGVGAKVTGSFSVLFDSASGLGAGRTAFGDFSATVRAAGAIQ